MESKFRLRWLALAAVAPIVWGSVYFVTRNLLPDAIPLWGGVYRALPAGIILFVIVRQLPRGAWWWRAAILGILNVGGFFALIYFAGTHLPSSLAATLMSAAAAMMLLLGWAVLGQRPTIAAVAGAAIGIIGVVVMLGIGAVGVDPWGVAASVGAMLSSSVGFVLTVRWGGGIAPMALASWQLLAGAILLVPFALIFEGAPPIPVGAQWGGFLYVTVVATAVAYAAWFTALQRLPAAAVGAVGLLNPVVGVILGVLLAREAFGPAQLVGILLVIAGVVISTLLPRQRALAAPPQTN